MPSSAFVAAPASLETSAGADAVAAAPLDSPAAHAREIGAH
jgi:hypothetical protein